MVILEYQRKTLFPTRRGNVRFRVDEDGGVYVQRNDVEPAAGHDWVSDFASTPTATIKNARKRVAKVLKRRGFFEMDACYENPVAMDGQAETLTYRDEDGERSVAVVSVHNQEFRKLVNKLCGELGIADDVA